MFDICTQDFLICFHLNVFLKYQLKMRILYQCYKNILNLFDGIRIFIMRFVFLSQPLQQHFQCISLAMGNPNLHSFFISIPVFQSQPSENYHTFCLIFQPLKQHFRCITLAMANPNPHSSYVYVQTLSSNLNNPDNYHTFSFSLTASTTTLPMYRSCHGKPLPSFFFSLIPVFQSQPSENYHTFYFLFQPLKQYFRCITLAMGNPNPHSSYVYVQTLSSNLNNPDNYHTFCFSLSPSTTALPMHNSCHGKP